MAERFVIRPDAGGYSVIDLWSGAAVVVAMTPQTRIPKVDAEHLVDLLNRSLLEPARPKQAEAASGTSATSAPSAGTRRL